MPIFKRVLFIGTRARLKRTFDHVEADLCQRLFPGQSIAFMDGPWI